MSKEQQRYFNFPIQLLNGLLIDTKKVLNDIVDYAIYENSLKLEYGTELEKMQESSNFFSVKLGNDKSALENGREIYNSLPTNSPKVGLSVSMFWDFYNDDKEEVEKVYLLSFLALKSIISNKAYCKVTNLYMWSRMDGKVKSAIDVLELSNEIKKFANRYQAENIKNELVSSWGLVYYSRYTRGFYVSFRLSLEDLIYEAEKKRKSTKNKQQKTLKAEALKKALERINGVAN